MPIAAIVAGLWAIAARVRRARRPQRRFVVLPLAVYGLFLIGVTLVELVRP